MRFKDATDRLLRCLRIPDIAEALGVSENTVARWRVDPMKEASREPSIEWQPAVARIARKRARELERLADQLERK